jgi:hypothetical protein
LLGDQEEDHLAGVTGDNDGETPSKVVHDMDGMGSAHSSLSKFSKFSDNDNDEEGFVVELDNKFDYENNQSFLKGDSPDSNEGDNDYDDDGEIQGYGTELLSWPPLKRTSALLSDDDLIEVTTSKKP